MNHPHPPFPDKEPLFFVDIPRLRGAMAQKGYNKATLAAALGISRPTLDKYLKHPQRMPYGVMQDMAQLLFDDRTEASFIFMARNWEQRATFVK